MALELDSDIFGTVPQPREGVNRAQGLLEPGIYRNIPSHFYHNGVDAISNSYLSRLAKCPAAAKVPQEETAALLFGRACHSFVLEGEDAFFNEFAVAPKCDRRTKDGKAAFAEFETANVGKSVITTDDFAMIFAMGASVKAHPFAKQLLAEGVSEQTVIWEDEETGLMCKCRPDRTPSGNRGVLVDLKTTTDASERSFLNSVIKYGYCRQASHYIQGINAGIGRTDYDAFAFIAVEKEAPFRCEVYILDDAFLEYGANERMRLLRLEKQCRKNNYWPAFTNAGAQDLYKPLWLGGE